MKSLLGVTIIGFVLIILAISASWGGVDASIGGISVPGLDCYEDEVISFVGIDTLDCVPIDIIRGE